MLSFLKWIPELRKTEVLRADILAGITVALVLVPQSMAYAQLAGLPPYYGLYAAFLPGVVAALFGSSRQLATGPVAVVSLMTASALEPLAATNSEAYLAYAVLLALLVGGFQLLLGLLRLGVLVDFLSHPVVVGFTNAAAIIIATSQLGKVFGVTVEKAEHQYETVWNTLVTAATDTHIPTLLMALLAFAVMVILRKVNPKIPNVLLAVVITTLLAWSMGFEQKRMAEIAQFAIPAVQQVVANHLSLAEEEARPSAKVVEAQRRFAEASQQYGRDDSRSLVAWQTLESLRAEQRSRKEELQADLRELKTLRFAFVPGSADRPGRYYLTDYVPEETDGKSWRLTTVHGDGTVEMHAGGRVVGIIPAGIPGLKLPSLDYDVIIELFSVAIAVSLIGFMEAISIAKAMATSTRQRLDANQELVGQGLGNIAASLFQGYAVSGSFSRSAVNFSAGAITGFSSVITGLVVGATLLWLTPLLYHLPQATLAAVIIMAVINLIKIDPILHAWKAQPHDAIVAVVTFVLTLVLAPHIDNGIIVGVLLSLGLFLFRTMRPRFAVLSRYEDGTMRDIEVMHLKTSDFISVIRFDGSLYFANAGYFESKVLEVVSDNPQLRYLILDGHAINQIDATGEEVLRHLSERLHASGIELLVARMKKQFMDVLRRTELLEELGQDRFFARMQYALEYAWDGLGDTYDRTTCPLRAPAGRTDEEDEDESLF